MNFNEFWKKLQIELKQKNKFMTLKQNKKFKVHFENNTLGKLTVRVILENGNPRGPIPSNEFEGIWNNAKCLSRETRFENNYGQIESYTTEKLEVGRSIQIPYITKLIDYIVRDQDME